MPGFGKVYFCGTWPPIWFQNTISEWTRYSKTKVLHFSPIICNQPPASKGKGLAAAAASFTDISKTPILLYDRKKETARLQFHQGQLQALMLARAYCAAARSPWRNINSILCMRHLLQKA